MKATIVGYTTLSGNPVTILNLMQGARVFDDLQGDDYIESVQQTAWRAFGIGLQVTGDTYEQRAESLLRAMADNEMIIIEEE